MPDSNKTTAAAPPMAFGDLRRGLIWGFAFDGGLGATPVETPSEGSKAPFRWLHFNLADRHAGEWLASEAGLPEAALELLTSGEDHQRALVVAGHVCGALSDFVHEFARDDALDTDVLRFAIGPHVAITTRVHPLHCADVIRRRIESNVLPDGQSAALDVLVSSVIEVSTRAADALSREVEAIEDALLDDDREPAPRAIALIRRRAVKLERQVTGLRAVLRRLERDPGLPGELAPVASDLAQQSSAILGDLVALQQQARLLREELDDRTARRTNQNLYILSIMTALLLPATLVTGIFGMNTGGLPLATGAHGTLIATMLSLGSALFALILLRLLGFFRR